MTASRSTISFTEDNWAKLSKSKNKSQVVNAALAFYFDGCEMLSQKEEEFILNELEHYRVTGECYSTEEVFGEDFLDRYK